MYAEIDNNQRATWSLQNFWENVPLVEKKKPLYKEAFKLIKDVIPLVQFLQVVLALRLHRLSVECFGSLYLMITHPKHWLYRLEP